MGSPEVRGELFGHLGAPDLLATAGDDLASYLPVRLDEDVVDGPGSTQSAGREGSLDGIE
jgi:hypothetical protein